jgi:hypothetical protein
MQSVYETRFVPPISRLQFIFGFKMFGKFVDPCLLLMDYFIINVICHGLEWDSIELARVSVRSPSFEFSSWDFVPR